MGEFGIAEKSQSGYHVKLQHVNAEITSFS